MALAAFHATMTIYFNLVVFNVAFATPVRHLILAVHQAVDHAFLPRFW
jgi:hypothetical protein